MAEVPLLAAGARATKTFPTDKKPYLGSKASSPIGIIAETLLYSNPVTSKVYSFFY